MTKKSGLTSAFFSVVTTHQAEICWCWTVDRLFDSDYHIRVNDLVNAKVKQLENKYEVQDDTRYCCQWEGHLLVSENRDQVEAAATELSRYVARFSGLTPLPA